MAVSSSSPSNDDTCFVAVPTVIPFLKQATNVLVQVMHLFEVFILQICEEGSFSSYGLRM